MSAELYFSQYHRVCSQISDNGNEVVHKYRITKRHTIPLLYESFEILLTVRTELPFSPEICVSPVR